MRIQLFSNLKVMIIELDKGHGLLKWMDYQVPSPQLVTQATLHLRLHVDNIVQERPPPPVATRPGQHHKLQKRLQVANGGVDVLLHFIRRVHQQQEVPIAIEYEFCKGT